MTDALGRVAMTSPSDPRRSHATPPGTTAMRNRYSVASDEAGESSSRNSEQQERSTDDTYRPIDPSLTDPGRNSHGRGSHRSHRSRASGAFLLSDNTFFEPPAHDTRASIGNQLTPPRKRQQRRDYKGKVAVRPSTEMSNGGSPLATHVKQADTRGRAHVDGSNTEENAGKVNVGKTTQTGLDVDSAQIVNLALNLSESRRQAARRVVTVPSPPTIHGFEDTFGGGSLRQHLQAQRRSSRNISPKPDKGEKFGVPPKPAQPITSPLQTSFSQDDEQKYQFSAATLARAEKAKNAFELMAQYRRLLQYLPPLKSQGLTPVSTISPPGTSAGAPVRPNISLSRASTATNKQMGRPYNPLQYIRNRKVRARERQPIDGEAQGFGDVDDVTAWVDRVAKHCPGDGYEISDCLELPPLIPDEGESQAHIAAGSDPSKPAAPPVKVKRPRIDWMISAPNMLADVVWLEQSDNKKLIEDNRERKIFPPSTNLVRLPTRTSEEQLRHLEQQRRGTKQGAEEEELAQSPDAKPQKPEKLSVETRLPAFNSIRRPSRNRSDTNHTPKIRHRLHKVARKLDGAGPLKSHRVDSDSSDSDDSLYNAQMRRGRSDTVDSFALNRDILEKQMSQMIAKETDEESKEVPEKKEEQKIVSSVEATPPPVVPGKGEESDTVSARRLIARKPRPELHRRNWSLNYGDKAAPLGRSSLEVPGQRPTEWPSSDLDTTAPNSPESKASKLLNALIPSISMDLSPPHSPLSPSHSHNHNHRMPLDRVRSKISRFRERSAEPLGRRRKGDPDLDADRKLSLQDSPGSPLDNIRSLSPRKKPFKGADNNITTPSSASLARQRPKDGSPPNMTGKPKSRNPIARVSGLLWTKDDTSASEKQGDTAPEDTDIDENAFESSKEESESSRRNSIITDQSSARGAASRKVKALLGEMSTFISPTERRGRPTDAKTATQMSPDYDAQTQQQKAHAKQRQDRLDRLKPPRIDIQRASGDSSPKTASRDRSPQGSLLRVHSADARLNSILNIPGISPMRSTFLPATDLAALAARRPSLVGSRPPDPSAEPTHITRQDVARVRALLLSSGIKAKELTRRHNELRDLNNAAAYRFATVAQLVPDLALDRTPRAQEHLLAARVLEEDMRRSARAWEAAAEAFRDGKVVELGRQVGMLHEKLDGVGGLSEQGKKAADEADELAKEVMGSQMLRAKALAGAMDTMMRRRRRRFRNVPF
ncbi:hypothetical protein V500_02356 [Pseudogymnoascus sp. VKM F-4518 (FW-2643)]|nr:hypothetical protein V500_02356 [Pseudogymnoascus sp. VKM F-4518 (FW-2643)]